MSKQQTAVEWFSNRAYELFEQYSEGKFDRITLNKLMLEATDKAKEMEKEQIKKIASYWQKMGILVATKVPNRKTFEQWYNETYGGNK
jgi:hypothetical protein